jgi:hypothetical protein
LESSRRGVGARRIPASFRNHEKTGPPLNGRGVRRGRSFTIFGHGGCFGDVGHCDVPTGPAELFDLRLPPPHPASKTVIITDALRQLRDVGTTKVTVTVVPIPSETRLPTGRAREGPVLKFDSVSLITYQ